MSTAGSLYNKYQAHGGGPGPLQPSQTATAESLKDVLGGVKDLMNLQHNRNVEKNTLDMQTYLKDRVAQGGLGAEPIDMLSIKKKYGNNIRMADLSTTVDQAKGVLTKDALDRASTAGDDVLSNTNDQMAATDKFAQTLKDSKMPSTDITKFTSNWALANENAFTRAETMANRQVSSMNLEVHERVAGGETIQESVYKVAQGLPEYKRNKFIIDSTKELQDSANFSEEDNKVHAYEVGMKIADDKSKAIQRTNAIADVQAEYDALSNYALSPMSISNAQAITSEFSQSVSGKIGDRVTNWTEHLYGKNDTVQVRNLFDSLMEDDNMSYDEAGGIMLQVFGRTYKGDKFFGNDLNKQDLQDMKDRAHMIAKTKHDQLALVSKINEMTQAKYLSDSSDAKRTAQFGEAYRKALRNENLRREFKTVDELKDSIYKSLNEDTINGGGTTGTEGQINGKVITGDEEGAQVGPTGTGAVIGTGANGTTVPGSADDLKNAVKKSMQEKKDLDAAYKHNAAQPVVAELDEDFSVGNLDSTASFEEVQTVQKKNRKEILAAENKRRKTGGNIVPYKFTEAERRAQGNEVMAGLAKIVTAPVKFANDGLNQLAGLVIAGGKLVVKDALTVDKIFKKFAKSRYNKKLTPEENIEKVAKTDPAAALKFMDYLTKGEFTKPPSKGAAPAGTNFNMTTQKPPAAIGDGTVLQQQLQDQQTESDFQYPKAVKIEGDLRDQKDLPFQLRKTPVNKQTQTEGPGMGINKNGEIYRKPDLSKLGTKPKQVAAHADYIKTNYKPGQYDIIIKGIFATNPMLAKLLAKSLGVDFDG